MDPGTKPSRLDHVRQILGKHGWFVVSGLVFWFIAYLVYLAARFLITYPDDIWNNILWEPIFGHSVPFVGFLLTVIIAYFTGIATSTRAGIWILRNVLNRIPLVGKFFKPPNPRTHRFLRETRGCVLARFQSEWRAAKFSSFFPTKKGFIAEVYFLTFPPTPQVLTDQSPIQVFERTVGNYSYYSLLPMDVAIALEATGGTTLDEDTFEDLVTITLGEFLKARGIGRKADT